MSPSEEDIISRLFRYLVEIATHYNIKFTPDPGHVQPTNVPEGKLLDFQPNSVNFLSENMLYPKF